jgi:hypothetical protein
MPSPIGGSWLPTDGGLPDLYDGAEFAGFGVDGVHRGLDQVIQEVFADIDAELGEQLAQHDDGHLFLAGAVEAEYLAGCSRARTTVRANLAAILTFSPPILVDR